MKQKKHSPIRNSHIFTTCPTLWRGFIFTFSYFLICSLGISQVSDKGFPSPNAAALGKYADYPVSYFTGVPAINIPLYTLKDGAAILPISLSYHASGIKVGEVASWVGTGWVLNAGGVITRTIKGAPDEGSKNKGTAGPTGYYKDSGLIKFPVLDMVSNTSSNIRKVIDNISDNHSVDAEPDIYTFNINGMVGKFIFDEYRRPKFLTQSDVKVNVDYSSGDFQRWTIITPNGIQYVFGENGAKENNGISGSGDADNNAPTAWYLTKIIYPNNTDTLKLEYFSDTYSYYSLASEFTTADDSATLSTKMPNGGYILYRGDGVIPAAIKSKNIVIDFVPNYGRYDVWSGHSLNTIVIKDRNTNKIIDQITLNYDYFTSSTAGSPELGTTDITDTKRLKLVSLQSGKSTSPIQLPPYQFEYYEDTALPRRCSYDVDHWGYANAYGGHNNRFTPNTTADFKTYTLVPPAGGQYRGPKWPYTKAFSIKKITDPAGVTTSFEFEPNIISKDTIGGGMRIKRITTEDPITKQKQIRRFDYSISSTTSSGIVFRKPSYWMQIYNQFNPVSSTAYSGESSIDIFTATGAFCKFSQSPLPLQDYQGYAVGYTQVKELFSENGENGYNIYTYQALSKPMVSTRLAAYNFLTIPGVPLGKWNSIPPQALFYADIYTRGKFFPFEPLQIDLYNGLLTKQEAYNSNGKLLQSATYKYAENYIDNNWFRGFVGVRIPYKGSNIYPFTYYKYRTGTARLMAQKTTIVDSITGGSSFTETKYAYESPNHLQPTRQVIINSTADTIVKVIRYSFDFDNNAISGGVITEMKNQNILTPLRVETWNNDTLTSYAATEYAKNAVGTKTTVVPVKTYTLENSKILSAADVGFNKSFIPAVPNLNGSSSLMKLQSFYSYDNLGLLKQQGKINDIPLSYIWDYNNSLTIAVASNTAPEDIGYTSFEADGSGGWTIGSTDRNTTTSVTGTKSYDLSKGNITKTELNSSKTYWVDYWAKDAASINVSNTAQTIQGSTKNGYTLWKKKITGITSVTISGTGIIDELRLYPNGSEMINYTYLPGIGISSKSSGENIAFYEYDEVNRLRTVRDANKNIIQQYCYNTAGKPISCDGTVFKNAPISQTFTRNNCGSGFVPDSTTYTIPQGRYISIISQADADAQAQTDMLANGQNYANANGICTTTYVKLSYENVDATNPNLTIGDVVVRFYQDAACTVPKTVNNLIIRSTKTTSCTGNPPTGKATSTTCNGIYFYIEKDATLYEKYDFVIKPPEAGDECFYNYKLNAGSNYIVK